MIPLTIRNKILLMIGGTIVALILLLLVTSQVFLMSGYDKLERQVIHQNLLRVQDALNNELVSLNKLANDWANRDDTYRFMVGKDTDYIEKNLADYTFKMLGLTSILYLDRSFRLVYGKFYDLENQTEVLNKTIQQQIDSYKELRIKQKNMAQSGIILSARGPILLAICPIFTSERTGPSNGTLIMGRLLDKAEVDKFAEITHLPVSFDSYSKYKATLKNKEFLMEQHDPYLIGVSNKTIIGRAYINDIFGKPALVASISMNRNIYKRGQTSIFYFILVLIGLGCILTGLTFVFFEKVIIHRLALLNTGIHQITTGNDLSMRLQITGNDELTGLTKVINEMLNSLELSHLEFEESRQQMMDIIEFLPDATMVIDQNHQVVAWNRAIEEMTGVKKQDMIGKGNYTYAVPFYGKKRPMLIDLVNSNLTEVYQHFKHAVKNGAVLSAEVYVTMNGKQKDQFLGITASPLLNKQGELMGAIESIRDITVQKKAAEELKYLSLHDQLTGLYNRAYFEEEIQRLSNGRFTEIGVVMCDVDGLKLVNDSLGHQAGDKLLQEAAKALKKAFRHNDVVARIGGDEFAVLLPQCNEKIVESAGKRIQDAVMSYNQKNPEIPLSISVGLAFRRDNRVGLEKLIEDADNNMYHEKLHRNRSARSAIVQTLMKTLNARDLITEGHADRMKDLVVNLSRKIGLPMQRIHDISLLAQFHDIGKVGIPDHILFKPGPLSPDEKKIMQRHSEIGYNIAKSANELLYISDWILMHHERWDGKGYPRGLKGEEVPLECRILSIIDAYDAMTSDRPYRKALTHQEALAEIRLCAGTQFDPYLVEEFCKIFNEH